MEAGKRSRQGNIKNKATLSIAKEQAKKNPIAPSDTEKQGRITVCMGTSFNTFVRKNRTCLITILFCWGVACIIIGTFIGPLTEDQKLLPDDHPIVEVQQLLQNDF